MAGDTFPAAACLINMNTSASINLSAWLSHSITCSLLALTSALTTGCYVSIDDPGLIDDGSSEVPHCMRVRQDCLERAGSDSRFREICHESYNDCIGQPEGPAPSPAPGQGLPQPDNTPDDPSKKVNDPEWNRRCEAIEAACFTSAGTSDEKDKCTDIADSCAGTFCGQDRLCSSHQTSPELLACWDSYLVCNDKARDDDEIASCGTVFRLCGQGIQGFEVLSEQHDEDVLDCLTSELRCQSVVKGQAPLGQTCRTVFAHCLVE